MITVGTKKTLSNVDMRDMTDLPDASADPSPIHIGEKSKNDKIRQEMLPWDV